jgi:putative transposase
VGRYPFDVELFHLLLQAGLSRRFPLIWNQRQLRQVLTEYLQHYNGVRPHRALDLHPPDPARAVTTIGPPPAPADVRRADVLGGLIHEYQRAA